MRKPFISANWKMNKTINETKEYFREFIPSVNNLTDREIIIAPSFTSLSIASELVRDTNIKLAAQNIFYEEKGAFTGEISPAMLLSCGCTYVIVGHSERRQYFNETDEIVNKKVSASNKNGLKVIMCIGESLEQRESGETFEVLNRQIENGLKNISSDNIVTAYEPIWAIGTGKTATIEQAQEAHAHIRARLKILYGKKADEIRIIYGGSVTPENVDALMSCNDVDGALVGGASLKPGTFTRIVKFMGVK
ncbi:MAG: triose-phosphate isomerase [Nitrospiraceae bacterium]|nr:triose-phosphate isomerase [Nitrospiraceae bacterium]